ncbi:Uncharacterized protein F58A4.6 [Toxocara canis]|uniref:Uncharacterized protein F58A4.6 n=1 Tax=Toxocara canis TaxID=6265 RepID=A0A0B2VDZ4_TOXCA|nr:Uncharacterized protein F58A4.6 [Toxocara canis]
MANESWATDMATCRTFMCSTNLFTMVLYPVNKSKRDDLQGTNCKTRPSIYSIKWRVSQRFFRSTFATLWHNLDIINLFIARLSEDYTLSPENIITLRFHLDEPLFDSIDYSWDERISSIVYRSVQMECHLWVLSTLGGAFSAMGDYYSHFAEKAGRISVRQLRLAFDLGDPVLISRCKLYIALFLTQKYCFKKAMQIVREEYSVGKQLHSELLLNCCEGVWMKIKSTRKKRHEKVAANNTENGYIIR